MSSILHSSNKLSKILGNYIVAMYNIELQRFDILENDNDLLSYLHQMCCLEDVLAPMEFVNRILLKVKKSGKGHHQFLVSTQNKCTYYLTAENIDENLYYFGLKEIENKTLADNQILKPNEAISNQCQAPIYELDEVINSINSVIWSVPYYQSGKFTLINKAAENLYEQKLEDLFLDDEFWKRNIHVDDIQMVNFSKAHLPEKSFYEIEYRLVFENNRIKWVNDKTWLVRDADGQPLRIDCTINEITEKKIYKSELNQSEKKYRLLFENMIAGFSLQEIMMDAEGNISDFRFLDANRAYEKLIGVKKEDMVGKTMLELFPMTQIEMIRKFGETAKTGISFETEYYSTIFKKYLKVFCYSPQLGQFASIFEEITERKSNEIKMKEITDRLNIATRSANIGIWDLDVKTNNLLWNETMHNLYEIDKDEPNITLNFWISQIHPNDKEKVISDLHRSLYNGAPYNSEYRIKLPDGQIRHIKANARIYFDENNMPLKMVGVNMDVTPYKMLNRQLEIQTADLQKTLVLSREIQDIVKYTNKLYELIVEISILLIQSSVDEIADSINQTLALLGKFSNVDRVYIFMMDLEKGIMSNIFEWCNHGVQPEIANLQNIPNSLIPNWLVKFIKNEHIYIHNVNQLDDSALEKEILQAQNILSLLTIPMFLNKKLVGFIGFDSVKTVRLWEIAHISLLKIVAEIIGSTMFRKEFENQLIIARKSAEEANKAKSEFLTNMSHEIRTPMNAILGFTDILIADLETPKHKDILHRVHKSGEVLLGLINDILDLSKIESGKLQIINEPINIKNIIVEIQQVFSLRVSEKQLNFQVVVDSNFPNYLFLDEIRIRQILFNLVGNAIKFTQRGDVKLTIGFSKSENPKFVNVIFTIEDTGIGIPNSEFEKIFDAFHQQSGESNRRFEGTGIGLAITKKLVEKMNGTIDLKSKINEGSVFRIELPDIKVVMDEVKTEIDQIDESIIFDLATILIIDDIDFNINIVKNLLVDQKNIRFCEANSSEKALELLSFVKPDIIFMDLRLNEISGVQITKMIKNQLNLKKVPIIAYTVTDFGQLNEDEAFLFAGVLNKPLTKSSLWNVLCQFISFKSENSLLETNSNSIILQSDTSNYAEIWTILEHEITPEWLKIKDQLMIFEIENFIYFFENRMACYENEILKKYIDELKFNIQLFNIEDIEKDLEKYPQIAQRFKIN